MGKNRGACFGSFVAARELGYHNIQEKPRAGEPQIHASAVRAFMKAVERGDAPPPDFTIGEQAHRWYQRTIDEWKAKREALAKGQQKKPESGGNQIQAETTPPVRAVAGKASHRSTQSVKTNAPSGVSHG